MSRLRRSTCEVLEKTGLTRHELQILVKVLGIKAKKVKHEGRLHSVYTDKQIAELKRLARRGGDGA